MSRTRPLDHDRISAYADAMRVYVDRATLSDVEAATVWYDDATAIADDIARRMDIPREHGAAIISAFSPRMPWARNVALALAFADGEEVRAMGSHIRAAQACAVDGIDALRGPKTNAFARAIAGDPDAIVVDVWMMRAAGMTTDAPTVVQYREISAAVDALAREYGMTPRVMQALVWIVVRGGAH